MKNWLAEIVKIRRQMEKDIIRLLTEINNEKRMAYTKATDELTYYHLDENGHNPVETKIALFYVDETESLCFFDEEGRQCGMGQLSTDDLEFIYCHLTQLRNESKTLPST